MRLGIDVDGVLADWEGRARALLQDAYGLNLPVSTDWDSIRRATTDEQWGLLWGEWGMEQLFQESAQLPGGRETLALLKEMGHEIAIITCVPKAAHSYRVNWLQNQGIPYDSIHFVSKLGEKSQVACDLYVDDGPQVLMGLLADGVRGRLVGVKQPWNFEFRAHSLEARHNHCETGCGAVEWIDSIMDLPKLVLRGR